jgi:hypothetical protein
VTLIATAVLVSTACVQVEGGAVELSWCLRDFQGAKNDCAQSRIEQIRVCWVPVTDGGAGPPVCTIQRTDAGLRELFDLFECSDKRGVTRFQVPTGANAFFVQPICIGGGEPTGPFQVPSPIVRTVESGQVVTLNQVLIIAANENCQGADCTCASP